MIKIKTKHRFLDYVMPVDLWSTLPVRETRVLIIAQIEWREASNGGKMTISTHLSLVISSFLKEKRQIQLFVDIISKQFNLSFFL